MVVSVWRLVKLICFKLSVLASLYMLDLCMVSF
jgi:hypothetical protein